MTDPKPVTVNYMLLAKHNDEVDPFTNAAETCTTVKKLREYACQAVKNRYAIDHQSLRVHTTSSETDFGACFTAKTVVNRERLTEVFLPTAELDASKHYILEGTATPIDAAPASTPNYAEWEKRLVKVELQTTKVPALASSVSISRLCENMRLTALHKIRDENWITSSISESMNTRCPIVKKLKEFIAVEQPKWMQSQSRGQFEVNVLHEGFKFLIQKLYDVKPDHVMELGTTVGKLVHTSAEALDCGIKPDFSLIATGYSNKATGACKVLIEIARSIDSVHIVRLATVYNQALLAFPTRHRAFSMLTNLVDVMFVVSSKDSNGTIDHDFSPSMELLPGLLAMKKVLESDLINQYKVSEYEVDNGTVMISRALGSGVSGHVFAGEMVTSATSTTSATSATSPESKQPVAVKIFTAQQERDFDREVQVWNHILPQDDSHKSRLCKLVGMGNLVLVYTPIMLTNTAFASTSPWACYFEQLFDAVKDLQSLGVVHRDLSPRHLMLCPNKPNKLMICDLGFAVFKNLQGKFLRTTFSGSTRFAPRHVLTFLCEGDVTYLPTERDDVESACKICLCLSNSQVLNMLREIPSDDFEAIAAFWTRLELSLCNEWRTVFSAARSASTPSQVWALVKKTPLIAYQNDNDLWLPKLQVNGV